MIPESIKNANVKMTFGLQPEDLEIIEKSIGKDKEFLFLTMVWDRIGKEMGWTPLAASLHYLERLMNDKDRRLENQKINLQDLLSDLKNVFSLIDSYNVDSELKERLLKIKRENPLIF